jgi:guanylate cyclase
MRAGTLILASVLIALLAFVWVGTYLAFGHPLSAAIPALYQMVTVLGLVVLTRTRQFGIFRTTQLATMLVLPALLQVSLGGFVASSGMILWALFVPLAALALIGLRASLGWLAAFLAALALLALLDPLLVPYAAQLPRGLVIWFFVLNVLGVTLSAYVMLAYFVEQRARAHRALAAERERSERLLLNVLPPPIADRLKETSGVIAERHESVTVLFADLVGFTGHTRSMPPERLVELLDRIFTAFDQRAAAEGLEKIKTIGDAYMVAGGVPAARPGHVEAVARLALAIREDLATIAADTGESWLQVRVGIDTGPVVAGVIGRRKFTYDLWGDTVNTASRMQSSAPPGEIHVTGRVAEALGDAFVIRPQGAAEVRGLGTMETFLLVAARPPDATP